MRNVDLSLVKAGDLVKFQCGGSAKIESISESDRIFNLCFEFDDFYISYNVIGICQMTTKLIDIIKVESK